MHTLKLKPHEVYFFWTRVQDLGRDRQLMTYCRSVINEKEQLKTQRYIFEKDRNSCLATRALLRYVLSLATGMEPAGFDFVENPYGRPELKPGIVDAPIRFNLSHSSGVTVCALALDTAVGVDIEDVRRKVDVSIADRFFSDQEADYLTRSPGHDRQSVFFDFWTLKESYIKAKGKGLSIGLESFSFDIDMPDPRIRFHGSNTDSSDLWQFFRFSPLDHYKAAIAVEASRATPVTLHRYRCVPFRTLEQDAPLFVHPPAGE